MNKPAAALTAACVVALTGFVVHVATQDWAQSFVDVQMQGRSVRPSWDVRYLALLTSIESGLAIVLVYALLRRALPKLPSFVRGLLLAVLLLAVTGRLVRQPLMNLVIGNPLPVVAVQDGVTWLTWFAMCVVCALVYDWLASPNAP